MSRMTPFFTAAVLATALSVCVAGCTQESALTHKPHNTLFIGVDASGSFKSSGYYDNALLFLAHYSYGHLHALGGLDKPQAMFIASVGGKDLREPKSFHPIHDFEHKDIPQIEAELRKWFPPADRVTDFNPFFAEVARITKERNLMLAPINVMIITDGVPDAATSGTTAGSQGCMKKLTSSRSSIYPAMSRCVWPISAQKSAITGADMFPVSASVSGPWMGKS